MESGERWRGRSRELGEEGGGGGGKSVSSFSPLLCYYQPTFTEETCNNVDGKGYYKYLCCGMIVYNMKAIVKYFFLFIFLSIIIRL